MDAKLCDKLLTIKNKGKVEVEPKAKRKKMESKPGKRKRVSSVVLV